MTKHKDDKDTKTIQDEESTKNIEKKRHKVVMISFHIVINNSNVTLHFLEWNMGFI